MPNLIRRLLPFAFPVTMVAAAVAVIAATSGSPDARKLFAAKTQPAALPTESIGSYTNGCVAGASQLPLDGPHHQVMRPSRNRYWGHPSLIDYIEKLADRAHQKGWNGLLIGDLSMPRGGPMPSGHASHMMGLDVDIWLIPAPDRKLTTEERETMPAPSVLKIDSAELDPNVWTPEHATLVREAAQDINVARVFVTPAVKKYLCQRKNPDGSDAWWMSKIRPCHSGVCGGHDDHIHVRLKCPPGDKACRPQPDPDPTDDGCGQEITDAMNETAQNPPYSSRPPTGPIPPKKPFPLNNMPKQCIGVLNAKP